MTIHSHYRSAILFLSLTFFSSTGYPSDDFHAQQAPNLQVRLDEEVDWLTAESYIYSVSRQEERLFQTPAAAYVITADDIRRSGATSIPELLRLVPGVQVARIDANKWAITIRGFDQRFASKLLVLVDGYSIYTPLFGGVQWEIQDLLLEDIERIEVIRGPGAALWGANAENGVINIITKNSSVTTGSLIEAGGGNEERGIGGFRYGGHIGENTSFRVFGKYFDHDSFSELTDEDTEDDWRLLSGGFRIDWQPTERDDFMFSSKFYDINAGTARDEVDLNSPISQLINDEDSLRGGNLLARWDRRLQPYGDLRLQMVYDVFDNDSLRDVNEKRQTFDLDVQHRFAAGNIHDIVWGAGYRISADETRGTDLIVFQDRDKTLNLYSLFVQDRIQLLRNRLYLTLGSKFEHNDFTNFEIQPSARLQWLPTTTQTLWISVARAVRTPSRVETSLLAINRRTPMITQYAAGNEDADSEKMIAYELGYRIQPVDTLTLDLAVFFNDYSDLTNIAPVTPESVGLPSAGNRVVQISNNQDGEIVGLEVLAEWTISDFWKVSASYSFIDVEIHANGSATVNAERLEESSPEHMANLRSVVDLPWNLEFDLTLHYVDEIVGDRSGGTPIIPDYVRLDCRLGWQPLDGMEFDLVVQNALDPEHQEFSNSNSANASEIQRSVFARVKWRF